MSLPERLSLEQIKAAQQSVETPIEPIKTPTPPFPTVGGEPEPTGYERLPGPGTSTVIPLAERLKQALATQRTYEGLAPQIDTTLPGDIAPPAVGVGRPGQAVTPLPTAPGVTLTPVAERPKTAVERAQELAAAIPTRVPEGPFPTFGGEEGVPVEEWEHVYPTIRDPMKEQTPAQKQFSKGTAVGIGIAKAPHVREEVKALEGPKGVAETLARGAGWLFGSALRIAALAPIGGAAAKAAGPLSEIVGTKLAPQVVTGAAGLAARATAGSLWESAVSEDRGTPAEIAKRAVGSAAVGGAIGGLLGAVQAYVWPRVVDAWRVRVRHELPRLEAAEVKLRQAGFEKVGANTWVPKDEAETVGQAITAGTKTAYPFSSSTLVTVPKYGQIHVYSLLDLQRGKVWDAAAKQLVNIPRWVYGEAAVQQLYGAPGPLSGIEFITTTRMLPNAEIPTGYWYGPMRPTGPPVTGEPAKQLYEAQLPQAGGKAFVLHVPARTVMGQTMPAVTQWSTDGTTWHTISASEVQPHITKLIAGGGGELLPTAGEFIAPPPDAARIAAEAVARNNYDLDRAVIQLLSPRGTGSNILRLSAEQLAALRPAAQVAVSQIQTLQQAGAEQPFLRLPEALGGLVGQIVAIHPQKPSVVDVKTLNGTVVQVDIESIEEPATVVAAPIDLLTAAQQKAAGRYANQVVVDIADADKREGVRLLAENLYASALLRHQTGGNDAPWIELSLSPEQIVTEPARELTAEEAGAIRNIVARLDVETLETLVSQLTPGEYEQLRRAVPDLPSWDIAPEVVEKLREETTQARVGAEGFEIAFRGGYTPATMTLTADTVALNVPPAFPRRNDVLVMLRKYGFDTEKATGHWVASLSPETRQIAALLSGQQVPVGDLSESVQQAFSELFSFPVVGEGPGAVADQATEATTKPTVPEEGPPATFTPGQILSTSGKIQLKVLSVKPEGIEVQQTINEDGKPVAPDSPGAVPYTVREDVLRKITKGVVGAPAPTAPEAPAVVPEGPVAEGVQQAATGTPPAKTVHPPTGITYYRYTARPSPVSDWGHMMFADSPDRTDNYGRYGWTLDESLCTPIDSLRETIMSAWEHDLEHGFTGDFGNDLEAEHLHSMTPEQVADSFDPDDIVNSAEAWDSPLAVWFWERIAEPNDIKAVSTRDGAVCFDPSLVKPAQPSEVEAEGPRPAAERPGVAAETTPPAPEKGPVSASLPIPVSKDDIPFDLARRAHEGTSFTPEKRAEQVQADYVRHMEELYDELKPLAESDEQKAILKAELEQYKARLIGHYRAVLGAKSRTLSSNITGPSNFPTARNQRALAVEQKRIEEMTEWQNRAQRAIEKKLKGARTEEQVSTAELARLKKEAASVIGTLKAIEAGEKGLSRSLSVGSLAGTLRRSAAAGNVSAVRDALDFIREQQAKHLNKPVFTERHGVWKLAEQAEVKPTAPAKTGEETIAEYAGAKIIKNYDADRTQIVFDERVSDDIKKSLRGEGWNWSRTNGAWQRKLTANAEYSAKRILERHFGEAKAAQAGVEQELRAEPTGPAPKNLAQVQMDTVDELPPEIALPNKDYAMHLFDAARQLDTPARYAKLRKDVLGQYKPEEEKITLRSVKAIATIAHELAHALDFKMSGRKYPSSIRARFDATLSERAARDELKAISQIMRPVEGGPGNFSAYRRRHTELMADFYSMYLLDPDLARSTAPLVSQAFEAQLNKNAKIKAVIGELLTAREQAPPRSEARLREIVEQRVRPLEDVDALLKQARTNPHHYTDTTLKLLDAVRHTADILTGKRPTTKADARYLHAVRDVLIVASRLKMAKVLDIKMRAEKWRKELPKERLEDLGALVEGIENLKTGKMVDEGSLTPQERQILKEYRFLQEAAREELNKLVAHLQGPEYIKYVEDYLLHLYENPGKVKRYVSKWAKTPPSSKARHFPTLKEALEAGLKPKTQNIADLHQAWGEMNFNAAINQVIVGALKHIVNEEGVPILLKPDAAPPDWPRIDHPAIQKVYGRKAKDGKLLLWRGGVCVDPEAYKYIHAVFDQPFTGSVVRAVETINAFAKAIQLSLSLFHPWNLTESFSAFLATPSQPLRGLVVAGGEMQTLGAGWRIPGTKKYLAQPHRIGKKLLEDKAFRDDAIMAGLEINPIPDAQVRRVMRSLDTLEQKTRKVWGINHAVRALRGYKLWFDNALWANYHAGGKAYIYYSLVADALNKAPDDITPAQVRKTKELIAELVNDGVGGQEWAKKFWATPKVRQALHIAMLAPDYTISNFNIARKAVDPRYVKDPVARRILWKYWITMILAMGGILDGINYASTGKHLWQNEPGRRTTADVTPIKQKLAALFGREPDKRRSYVAPGKQVREVLRYFNDPLTILGSKASPTVRMLAEQFTSHQLGSGWAMPWAEEEMTFYQSIPERLKAVYENFVPFSFRSNQFAFAWPLQRGMGWWQAQRAYEDLIAGEVDPSLYRRLIGKKDYDNLKTQIDEAAELNGLDAADLWRQANTKVRGDYYSRFWQAVNAQNWKEAERTGKILLELGVEPEGLIQSGQRRDIEPAKLIKGLESYAKGVKAFMDDPHLTPYLRFMLEQK